MCFCWRDFVATTCEDSAMDLSSTFLQLDELHGFWHVSTRGPDSDMLFPNRKCWLTVTLPRWMEGLPEIYGTCRCSKEKHGTSMKIPRFPIDFPLIHFLSAMGCALGSGHFAGLIGGLATASRHLIKRGWWEICDGDVSLLCLITGL